ncbi:2425_t:CDS:2 [Dentiscutata heterogama]|uniref:2425_t:CDS:1 n=1 Tax=Dentiscutata heterogama TaxID=1316150 RepID=A0ACA9KFJ8_9GLOM|nr:2425_t:CDS:2 [Dentiscutata heterogama]
MTDPKIRSKSQSLSVPESSECTSLKTISTINPSDSTNQHNAYLDKNMHSTNSISMGQIRRNNGGGKLNNLNIVPFLFRSGRRYFPSFVLLGILFVFTSIYIVNTILNDDLVIDLHYDCCDQCADIIKKPKLDQHRIKCPITTFTCIDCSKTFVGTSYKSHTSCISEAEKYQKGTFKPKKKNAQDKPKLSQEKEQNPSEEQQKPKIKKKHKGSDILKKKRKKTNKIIKGQNRSGN